MMAEQQRVAIVDHVGVKAGMECYDLGLYYALIKGGCSVLLFSNFREKNANQPPFFSFRLNESVFSFIGMMRKYHSIAGDLARNNIQHCIVHGFRFGFAEWLLIRLLSKSRAKIYMIVHDPESLIGIGNRDYQKNIFRLCSGLVVHNRFSYDEVIRQLDVTEKSKLHVIPHGHVIETAAEADIEAFRRQHGLDMQSRYLLFFGQIKKTKGLDLLLNALPKTETSVKLIIAGRMRKHRFDEYQKLIQANNLKDRVIYFPGYIDVAMRNNLFHVADAVVLPYRKVYQSGVMLMAMSYQKAVIASDLPPNKSIITDQENGFLFTDGDVDSLKAAISLVMEEDKMRGEVGARGKSFAMIPK